MNKRIFLVLIILLSSNSFALFDKKIILVQQDQNITENHYDVNLQTYPDFNSIYVSWIDGNKTYLMQVDANLWFIKISDSNNVSRLNYLVIANPPFIPTEADIDNNSRQVINSLDLNNSLNYLKTASADTNWMTSWNIFDANMKYYYPLKTDINLWINARTWDSADFNSIYLNSGGSGSGDLNQVDANKWYWKQFDLNARLQISDFNNVWVSWKDGNATYIKITDTNNASRINYNAIADLNSAYYTQLDANTIFIKISDSNNTGRLQAKVIADWNTESSMPYTVISDPPWLTTGDNLGNHIATQDLYVEAYNLWLYNSYLHLDDSGDTYIQRDEDFIRIINSTYSGISIDRRGNVGIGADSTGVYNLEVTGTTYSSTGITSGESITATKDLTVNGGDIITGVDTRLGSSTHDLNILIPDNNSAAFVIKQGTNDYVRISTLNSAETLTIGPKEPDNIEFIKLIDASVTSGHNVTATSSYNFCVGQDSSCVGHGSMAFGDGLISGGEQCFAINRNNICDADNSFVGGFGSDVNDSGGSVNFAYGTSCTASGKNSVAMGDKSKALDDSSVALGDGAVSDRANLVSLSRDVDINGFLTVGQGKDENRGLSIGDGNFSNNLYVQNTARIGKKLSINYNGTIDTGVQAHMKGDASNNANIRMDGFTSGFFYFGFNDTYKKAAMSVSNGTTTTWDALDVDANGKVGIGMNSTTPFTHRLEVDGNVYIQSNLKIDGNLMYSPDVNTRKNVHWIFPNDGRALNTSVTRLDYIDFDSGNQVEIECNTANPTLCLIQFPVSIDRLYGANNKITKIEVDMNKTSTLDNIDKIYLYSYNRGTGAFGIDYSDATWRAGKNLTASYRTYSAYSNSTGITMDFNRQYTIQLDVNNAASGGVKIYGIKIEYITT